MNKGRFIFQILAVAVFMIAATSVAQAQATRTWVSGVGDDVNPCSRTAPCKTFAGAISKTAAGGEISVLDPGGYGALTITKSITVDGGTGAGWASTLASGTNGFVVNANAATDVVHLRNISINGGNTGLDGIRVLAAKAVHVEDCQIFRFTGDGIDMNTSANSQLVLKDTTISECGGTTGSGVKLQSAVAGTFVTAVIENSRIDRCANGINAFDRSRVSVTNTQLTLHSGSAGNGNGLVTQLGGGNDIIVHLQHVNLSHNATGIAASGGQTRISDVYITNCGTSISTPANVRSWGDNMIVDNGVNNQATGAPLTKQ
jgi:hypothetical protein